MMKKIVMTMVALLTMTAAVAQENNQKFDGKGPKQPTVEQLTDHMAQDLKLDDKQKAQVLALNKEYQDVLRGPRMMHKGPRPQKPDGQTGATEQAPKDKKDKKDKAKKGEKAQKDVAKGERPERPQLTDEQKAQRKAQMEKRKEYNEKLKKILTDEQYKNFQKRQHGGPQAGHHRHGGPRGPRGPRPNQAA